MSRTQLGDAERRMGFGFVGIVTEATLIKKTQATHWSDQCDGWYRIGNPSMCVWGLGKGWLRSAK